ncbi:hypothetical protein VP01_1737g1 [Puccinia sorghi]|uniref:Uncharacterized protein n=1 Tax=Puccinia sorghi TaxID=27349 RepID=A0A0L6VFB5_9BASI|nr:hypothetical protein VP01_1737g1 [Puccinia sorghi]
MELGGQLPILTLATSWESFYQILGVVFPRFTLFLCEKLSVIGFPQDKLRLLLAKYFLFRSVLWTWLSNTIIESRFIVYKFLTIFTCKKEIWFFTQKYLEPHPNPGQIYDVRHCRSSDPDSVLVQLSWTNLSRVLCNKGYKLNPLKGRITDFRCLFPPSYVGKGPLCLLQKGFEVFDFHYNSKSTLQSDHIRRGGSYHITTGEIYHNTRGGSYHITRGGIYIIERGGRYHHVLGKDEEGGRKYGMRGPDSQIMGRRLFGCSLSNRIEIYAGACRVSQCLFHRIQGFTAFIALFMECLVEACGQYRNICRGMQDCTAFLALCMEFLVAVCGQYRNICEWMQGLLSPCLIMNEEIWIVAWVIWKQIT